MTESQVLENLRATVAQQIEEYRYDCPDTAIGQPWSDDKVKIELDRMRKALVAPYSIMVEIRDTIDQIRTESPLVRKCVVIADDGHGYLLAYSLIEESFLLADSKTTPVSSIGIWGDAVGCFLSI